MTFGSFVFDALMIYLPIDFLEFNNVNVKKNNALTA